MAQAIDEVVDEQLRDIIHNLYSLLVQVHGFEGSSSSAALTTEVKKLATNLSALSRSSRSLSTAIPPEVIEYVENGRNPDIYTREFVELVQQRNQQLKGKSEAFAQFRDALAREISGAMPEVSEAVEMVISDSAKNTQ